MNVTRLENSGRKDPIKLRNLCFGFFVFGRRHTYDLFETAAEMKFVIEAEACCNIRRFHLRIILKIKFCLLDLLSRLVLVYRHTVKLLEDRFDSSHTYVQSACNFLVRQ